MTISIIIPVHNVAPYLRECLDSVLRADGEGVVRVELVCVDDGSADGSTEILDEYAVRYASVKVIHQANAGVSAARNAGIAAATGEWLYFLDGDDVLIAGWLDKLLALIDGDRYDAFFLGRPCYFSTRLPERIGGCGRVVMAIDEVSDGKCLLMSGSLWGWPCIRLLRRSLFRDFRFPLGVGNLEDSISLIDVLSHRARWCWVDWQIYGYRLRAGSATHDPTIERTISVIRSFTTMYNATIEKLHCSPNEGRKVLWQYRRHMGAYVVPAIRDADVASISRVEDAYHQHEQAVGYHTAYWPVRLMLGVASKFNSRRGCGLLLLINAYLDRLANALERRMGIDVDLDEWYWRALRKAVRRC